MMYRMQRSACFEKILNSSWKGVALEITIVRNMLESVGVVDKTAKGIIIIL